MFNDVNAVSSPPFMLDFVVFFNDSLRDINGNLQLQYSSYYTIYYTKI